MLKGLMTPLVPKLQAFLAAAPAAALVEVADAKGSTPREQGAWMLVSPVAIFGTIGGGQLEYMAIDEARKALAARGQGPGLLDVALGPEIGQCCGGRVGLAISIVDMATREALVRRVEADDRARPPVCVFGGGHVGHALAAALALLPVRAVMIETRADALEGMPAGVETRLTPVPEEVVREAPAGSAFVILTHDHALDFLIAAEALSRSDAAYVGMIGSRTKKATFRSWYLRQSGGSEAGFARLVSPIGGDAVRDKRPAVIASLAAAEIMTALATHAVAAAARHDAG